MFSDSTNTAIPDTPHEKVIFIQNMLIDVAENGYLDESVYLLLRTEFMDSDAKPVLPEIIKTCRDHGSVWGHLKRVASGSGSWSKRRDYIYNCFTPFLDYLEASNKWPSDHSISEAISSFDSEEIYQAWDRALQRRNQDPEGAITAARSLLETVCKHILDDAKVVYSNDNLPKLYDKTAKTLNLAPSQHTEDAFKSILGGCQAVVQNLGTIRNRIGDAHGQGRNPVKPLPRHAALAVNLSGSMATFLIETWNAKSM